MATTSVFVGVAGWALRKEQQPLFPEEGSHLQRYAGRLGAVEINSSFYKPHQRKTYARWREETPEHFRFAVKAPREMTHNRRLREVEDVLNRFLGEIAGLEEKLGPVLVQLPPRLPLDESVAEPFFAALRERFDGAVVCEPRHRTWFTDDAETLLKTYRIGRVAADPPRAEEDGRPGGDRSIIYYRQHGAPKIYYSPYADEDLDRLSKQLTKAARAAEQTWCIFDNTAEGHATINALDLMNRLDG